jgi:hypothetical protein
MLRIALQRCLFISLVLLSRNTEAQPGPGGKSYMGIGTGLHYGYLRDAGVSPLTYRGPLLHGQANFFFDRTKWDYDLELGFGYGAYEATRSFRVASTVHNVQHNFGALRHLWANPRESLRLDGALSYRGFTNYRTTTAFRNNANVWESLHSLMAGARFQWDIHLNIAEGKTLFFKKKGGERQVRFGAQVHLPLLHSSWRPGFAYLEDFTGGDRQLGSANVLSWGGFRAYGRAECWYFLRNGNAWRLSYALDLQQGKPGINRLQTAQYFTQISLFARLN